VIVVGGGGHGLATAYYLARNHGVRRVAVLEKGWLGGGNTARNTAVIRSNYLLPASARLYDFSLRLYEDLSRELNFNVMFSQRGMLMIGHSRHDMELIARWANAMRFHGIAADMLDREGVRALVPAFNFERDARFPVHGGFLQKRGGIARHDAVAWGYARAASRLGVHLVQECEANDLLWKNGAVRGVRATHRGRTIDIEADRVGVAVSGQTGRFARMAGLRLPITSFGLQAMVTEPVKPVLDTSVFSLATGTYWSQSDKGEIVIGGRLDLFPSHAQRGSLAVTQDVVAATCEAFPSFGRLRLLRQWAGCVDVTPDSSPVIGATPVPGLYLNCGWGTGGFKSIPAGGWTFAHVLATGAAHPLAEPFGLHRFAEGRLIDEAAAAGIAH
jgi:sarcosine oxidase subunit beta